MVKKFFYHNSNLLYLIVNHKLSLKNKNCQTNINRLQEIGQKWSKTSICHHKQCIFDQKWAKMAKTRIFPDTTLPLFDWKQLSQVFEQVTWNSDLRFWRKSSKTWFFGQKWPKMAKKGQKRPNENFFQKSAWNIFLVLSRYNFVQKIIKIWCAVF